MATNCEDVGAQMMELLYGELPADARASVDAHVAGCARCRAELEGFQKTRAVARQALDEPPPRARVAILKAAAEHLAAQARPATRKTAVPERVSFWDRLRGRWALPTFATVGALAVFVIASRTLMNPDRAFEQTHNAVQAPGAPAPQSPPASTAEPPAPSEAAAAPKPEGRTMYRQGPAENERYDETAQRGARFGGAGKKALVPPADRLGDDQKPAGGGGRADDHRGLQKDAVGSGALHGAPTTPPAATAHKSRSSDDSLDGLLDDLPRLKAGSRAAKEGQGNAYRDQPNVNGKFAPPPPPRAPPAAEPQGEGARKAAPSAKRAIADNPLDGLDLDVPRTRRAPPPKPAQDKAVEDDSVNKSDGLGSGVAQRAAPAPRHEPAAKRPAIVAAAPAAEAPATTPAPGAAPPAPAAPPPAPAPAKSSVAYNADAEELAAPQESEAKSTKKEKKQSTAKGGPAETLAQRADRLFAAGRWSEAVEAYRELLRRDPHNDDADRWRRRLVAAESADTSQGNASVAERRAAEVKRAAPPASAAKPTRAPAKAKASAVDSAEQ